MKVLSIRSLAFAAVIAFCALPAAAQAPYPNHAIKLLVPIPPGGAPDVAARLIGQYLSESLGQPVVIENRSGANGNIAGEGRPRLLPTDILCCWLPTAASSSIRTSIPRCHSIR
jgi:tripartite-type tricarboxylate transporter receptor subunit TctC